MAPRLPKGSPGNARQVCVWLGMSGHTQPKVVASHDNFSWRIYPCKKNQRNLCIASKNIDNLRTP